MPVTGLNHYNLRASRELLEALRGFYCEVVGLRTGARPPFDSFGYWLYAGDDAILHLSEAHAGELRPGQVLNTFDHVAFSCGGLTSTEARLRGLGIAFRRAVVPQSEQVQLFLQDPAGNGIELNFASVAA